MKPFLFFILIPFEYCLWKEIWMDTYRSWRASNWCFSKNMIANNFLTKMHCIWFLQKKCIASNVCYKIVFNYCYDKDIRRLLLEEIDWAKQVQILREAICILLRSCQRREFISSLYPPWVCIRASWTLYSCYGVQVRRRTILIWNPPYSTKK